MAESVKPKDQGMSRPDISDFLIHFTRGESEEAAYSTLRKILREKRLIGSGRWIKGKFRCVCFSEAPLVSLARGLRNADEFSRYSNFGIMVSKQWLFTQGGRPVIYQTPQEYIELPPIIRWRHVVYEIREGKTHTDFTWEREWRIQCDELRFDSDNAQIILPNRQWAHRLVKESQRDEDYKVLQYSTIFDQEIAEQYREQFQWNLGCLNE